MNQNKKIKPGLILLSVTFVLMGLTACSDNSAALTSTTEVSTTTATKVLTADIPVTAYETDGSQQDLLTRLSPMQLEINKQDDTSNVTINVNDLVQYQEMDGFGAALTESAAYVIDHDMTTVQKTALLNDLFSSDGININFIRLPMGSSDFALNSYTYDDMPQGQTDVNLEHFSIAPDKQDIIPILQTALKLDPDLKIIATPWSPPAWMKTNYTLNGSTLNPEYYSSFAEYFVKFIQAYAEEGIPIYAITLQNEPLNSTDSYPSMEMEASQEAIIIDKYIGPDFAQNDIKTKIIAYDHNWDKLGYPETILSDQTASSYVSGTAFHCYAGDVSAQTTLHDAYPEKGIWLTECSGGNWSEGFSNNLNWDMQNLFIGGVNNYSKAVLLWNLVLDENDGPQNGGCTDCRPVVTVSSKDGSITRNVEYYALAQFSKFVKPGAYRINSVSSKPKLVETTAFKNPDGSIVLVVNNMENYNYNLSINYFNSSMTLNLPMNSVITFIFNPDS